MAYQVDLNCDLGEGFGIYSFGQDEEILEHVTSANIACGYHAGDHNVMARTVQLAAANGVGIGAHPGLPDLAGFGRRPMKIEPEEIYRLVLYQIGALAAFARAHKVRLNHVKAHGALYNMASQDATIAQAIAQAVYDFDPQLALFALSGSQLVDAGEQAGLKVVEEVFADRTYQGDGRLTPRHHPQALVTDPELAANNVVRMIKEGKTTAIDGKEIPLRAETICVHGDTPQALRFVRQLKQALQQHGIEIRRVGSG